MKKALVFLTFLIMTVNAFAQDSKYIYNKYSDEKGVSAVYISPAMFKMIGRIPEIDMGNGSQDISGVVRNLNGFYLISTENPKIVESIKADVKKFIGNGKFELMMEAKDDGMATRFYTIGNDEVINSFVMSAYDEGECTFICMDGVIDRAELERLLTE
ncbi:MAG: DUF4252 domain-containing protein [Bacteroidales bacterium]|nr:DUF4252 domain-containing protein [Bacteroidales bacterium]